MESAIRCCEEATSPPSWFLFGSKPYKGGGLKDDQLYYLPMQMSEELKSLRRRKDGITCDWFIILSITAEIAIGGVIFWVFIQAEDGPKTYKLFDGL